jgi:hypothetical protein
MDNENQNIEKMVATVSNLTNDPKSHLELIDYGLVVMVQKFVNHLIV